jgi:hypothetical protein
MSGDVFVIKWDLSSGLPEFAKLLGSRNSHEEATDAAATDDCGVLISMSIIAPFSIYQGNAYDTVGLVRAGRANAPGCRIENSQMVYVDAYVARDLGIVNLDNVTNPDEIPSVDMPASLRTAGSSSCFLLPHAPFFESGLFVKVVDGLVPEKVSELERTAERKTGVPASTPWRLAQHGSQNKWTPPRQCSRASDAAPWAEVGCNSDGVLWARMMANGKSFFSSQQARTSQIASGSAKHGPRVVIAGEFRGFIADSGSGGFQADDLSEDLNGGLVNDDIRDVASTLISLLE